MKIIGLQRFLNFIIAPFVLTALYLVFIWSPVERQMGIVQKIFYFHVGSAWNSFLAFFIVFIFSIIYLIRQKRIFDLVAEVSAEIGVVFTTISLITGSIWGRSAWNTWWSWEPRLSTTLILWFIYFAYVMIRKIDISWEKKARLSSVFGIIGFINVPVVYMSIRWWRSKLHPIVFGEKGGGIEPEMLFTLIFCVVTTSIIYYLFLQKRIAIRKAELELLQIKENIKEKLLKGGDLI